MNAEATESIDEEAKKELALGERGDPARTRPADAVFRFLHHLVSAAQDPRDLLRFEYWSPIVQMLVAGDILWCEPADRGWYVVLRVIEVGAEGAVVESIVAKETQRYQAPPPKARPDGTSEEDFEYQRSEEFAGKWCVVRKHDRHPMTKGQPLNRGQCEQWLKQYLATVHRS